MHPALVMMIAWTNMWCFQEGIRAEWTSWIRTEQQNIDVGARSDTHVQGRAADLSFKNFTADQMKRFEKEFYQEFKSVGALVEIDGELYSRPLVGPEDGHDHYHMQVRW